MDTASERTHTLGHRQDWAQDLSGVLGALPPTPVLTRPLSAGVSVHVCNEHRYGYMNVPVKSHQDLEDEKVNFIHLILEALGEGWGPGCPPASSVPQTRWAVGSGSQSHP